MSFDCSGLLNIPYWDVKSGEGSQSAAETEREGVGVDGPPVDENLKGFDRARRVVLEELTQLSRRQLMNAVWARRVVDGVLVGVVEHVRDRAAMTAMMTVLA